jgi:hypothetical protein
MGFHLNPLGRRKRASFLQQSPGNPDLPHIVAYPGQAHLPGCHTAETHLKGSRPGKLPNVPTVSRAISFEGISAGNHAPEGFEIRHQPQLTQEFGEQKLEKLRFCSGPAGS